MRVYTAHYQPLSPEPDGALVLVKEGFCWPAFLFTALWALFRRLWLAATLILVVQLGLELVLGLIGADALVSAACGLAVSVFVGLRGNDWRRARLARSGYRASGVVAAVDGDAAYRRFFDLHPDLASGRGTARLA